MNKTLMAGAGILILAILAIFLSHNPNEPIQDYNADQQSNQELNQQNTEQSNEQIVQQHQGCIPNLNPQFTTGFTDLSKVDALNPIGGLGGGSPARSYIGVKQGMEVPVYNPMDSTLEIIIYADRGGGYGEYGLIFRASCEVTYMFDHIDRISDNLKEHAPQTLAQTSNGKEVRVQVKAGELIGYTNGTDLARTFDFLVMNQGKKNNFINPSRWEWDQAVYGNCPYDYFVPDLKAQYYAKLGTTSYIGFVKADGCGNPSSDIEGTISGGWFKGDNTDKKGEYLGIARSINQVDVAIKNNGEFGSFRVREYSPAKYPADVKVGESICYAGNSQWAFMKLVSPTELSFASGTGSCPSNFPTEQATTWIR